MKGLKKLITGCLTASMLLASAVIPVSAAGWNWPTSYDMSGSKFPTGQMVNTVEGDNYGFFADPKDETNTVLGTRRSTDGTKYADMRAVMSYTTAAVQFDVDVYREAKDAAFEITLYANTGGASGNNVKLFAMNNQGKVLLNGAEKADYDTGEWYNVSIKTNMAKTYHEVYMKKRGEDSYKLIGGITNADLGFNSTVCMHYFIKNSSSSYTYLDNMSWVQLNGDLGKKVHYDFNDVTKTVDKYWPSLNINTKGMTYEQATFDGAQVLKSTQNVTADTQARTWEDVPDMDKIVISARMGMDSEGDAAANLPQQFGIMPNFAQPDGTKSAAARNNLTGGIRFEFSRYINLEGWNPKKDGSDGSSIKGYYVADGKLYDVGYVYDRINKVFKAYYITADGETIIKDVSSNKYVQESRYLAGVSLWSRGNAAYKTGKAYYDYLYIDEAEAFAVQKTTPTNNAAEVSLAPELKVEYNYVIDPQNMGTAVLTDASGESVDVTVSTYKGKTLVVKPAAKLASSKAYTLKVSGTKDLLGQTAEEVTLNFTTGSPIYMSDVVLNNGGALADGNNTVTFSLTSNDGEEYNVALIAALFDLTTNEVLDAQYATNTVPANGSTPVTLNYDTSEFSNYRMEVYVWSGLGTMKPYAESAVFTK